MNKYYDLHKLEHKQPHFIVCTLQWYALRIAKLNWKLKTVIPNNIVNTMLDSLFWSDSERSQALHDIHWPLKTKDRVQYAVREARLFVDKSMEIRHDQ